MEDRHQTTDGGRQNKQKPLISALVGSKHRTIMKTRRNLRALFTLGFIITLLASIRGGLTLALGYSQPSITQPMWQFGQYAMLLGLTNLFIYLCIFFQVRKLMRRIGDDYTA